MSVMGTGSDFCKNCGHPKDDHRGTAMICMKQVGKDPVDLCDCCWFDDGKTNVLPETLETFVSQGKEFLQKEMISKD